MRARLHAILVASACLAAACSDSSPESVAPSSTLVTATTTVAPPTSAPPPPAPSTTPTTRSLGGYNVTPVRSDGQRVTFRLTVPDGATGEVAISPADTTISSIEASIALVRPDGQSAGGGGIFTAAADDTFFASFCASTFGGNCAPKTSEPIADGNRVETFARPTGGTTTRVVFGPWAMFVRDRDVANAFAFRSGPDGFPLVAPLAAGYTTKDAFLRVYTAGGGPPYYMRSDPSGACRGDAAASGLCDRGLSFDPSPFAAPTVRRIN